MVEARMTEAIYIGPDSRRQVVILPDAPSEPNKVHYNPELHQGHLVSFCCGIKVNYDPGSLVVCGGHKGPSAHFQRNGGQEHKPACDWPIRENERNDDKEYDFSKGYRLNLNLTRAFNRQTRLYQRTADGWLHAASDEFAKREPYRLKEVGHILRLLRRGEFDRVTDSLVIFHDKALTWPEFFVRYNRRPGGEQTRLKNLFHRLQEGPQACAMEFNLHSGAYPTDLLESKLVAESAGAFLQHQKGRDHFLVPRVHLQVEKRAQLAEIMRDAGNYLTLGRVKLQTQTRGNRVLHFFDMDITHERQVQPVDLLALSRQVAAKKLAAG